jgi:acyl carrier protein
MDSVQQHLVGLLTEKFDVPAADVLPEATLEALELDSLARAELFVTLQEHWGISLEEDDSSAELTVAELGRRIGALLQPGGPAGTSQ